MLELKEASFLFLQRLSNSHFFFSPGGGWLFNGIFKVNSLDFFTYNLVVIFLFFVIII